MSLDELRLHPTLHRITSTKFSTSSLLHVPNSDTKILKFYAGLFPGVSLRRMKPASERYTEDDMEKSSVDSSELVSAD